MLQITDAYWNTVKLLLLLLFVIIW